MPATSHTSKSNDMGPSLGGGAVTMRQILPGGSKILQRGSSLGLGPAGHEVVEDLADPAPQRQVSLVVVEVDGSLGDVGGEPPAVREGNHAVLGALPDRHGHRDVRELEPPVTGEGQVVLG